MFFALTDEQTALGKTVTELLAERYDLHQVLALLDDAGMTAPPKDLADRVAEQGWLAVTVPEEHDGLGLGLVDAQVIARGLGAGVAPTAWLGTVVAAEAVRLGGTPELQAELLPKLGSGELVGTVALRRFDKHTTALLGQTVTATDGTLTGVCVPVEWPQAAGLLVVSDDEGVLYAVTLPSDGVTITDLTTFDASVRLGRVELAGVTATKLSVDAETIRQRATVLVASDLTGIAREALRRTVEYDKIRVQFNKPVGSFQALKHDLAEIHVQITLTEHAVLYAAHAVDDGLPDAAKAVSVAKAKASEIAIRTVQAMVQYHGGIGYTWEHEAHLFYKRAKRLANAYGDATFHENLLADELLARV